MEAGAVVKAACLESRKSRFRAPTLASKFQRTKCFSLAKIKYCGDREVTCARLQTTRARISNPVSGGSVI